MVWDPTHVQLQVHRAKGLLTKGKNGTNDAFVTMSLGKEKYQTTIKDRSGPNVEWNEECELTIPDQGNKAEIVITVYHRNMVGIDEFLGTVLLPLNNFDVYERPKSKWYPLQYKNEKKKSYRGEIDLTVNFTVKSGSLNELSKKDKHKGSLGQLSTKAHNLGKKLGRDRNSMRGDKRAESGYFERRGSGRSIESSSIGDPEQDEDEFKLDQLSHRSSNSSINVSGQGVTPVQGSLENLAGGEFLSKSFSGPRSGTLPANLNLAGKVTDSGPNKPLRMGNLASPDEWEKKLFGKNVKASERAPVDTPVESAVPSIVVQHPTTVSPIEEQEDGGYHFTRRNASRRGRKKLEEESEKEVRSAVVAPMPRNNEPDNQTTGTIEFETQHEHVNVDSCISDSYVGLPLDHQEKQQQLEMVDVDLISCPIETIKEDPEEIDELVTTCNVESTRLNSVYLMTSHNSDKETNGISVFETELEDSSLENSIIDHKKNLSYEGSQERLNLKIKKNENFSKIRPLKECSKEYHSYHENLKDGISKGLVVDKEIINPEKNTVDLGESLDKQLLKRIENVSLPETANLSEVSLIKDHMEEGEKIAKSDDYEHFEAKSQEHFDSENGIHLSKNQKEVVNNSNEKHMEKVENTLGVVGEKNPTDLGLLLSNFDDVNVSAIEESDLPNFETDLNPRLDKKVKNEEDPKTRLLDTIIKNDVSGVDSLHRSTLSLTEKVGIPFLKHTGVFGDRNDVSNGQATKSSSDDNMLENSSFGSPKSKLDEYLFSTPVSINDTTVFGTPKYTHSKEEDNHYLSPVQPDGDDNFIEMPIVGLSSLPSNDSFKLDEPDTTLTLESNSPNSSLDANSTVESQLRSIRVHESHRKTLEGIKGLELQPTESPELYRLVSDKKSLLLGAESAIDFNFEPVTADSYCEKDLSTDDVPHSSAFNGLPELRTKTVQVVNKMDKVIALQMPELVKEELEDKTKEELMNMVYTLRQRLKDRDEYISTIVLRCMEKCPLILESPLVKN
ncbi:uncharacterized protein LOC136043062 isoform X2 [Artemia franciscana]|uniref:C2 domain-containing protein n=1 Tax=Artemia franciscana TaxID=6661 RepID=A0AA88KTV5_ARTSF|nr:hypothetical protein QYM36_019398 [Artemia franciscana]